MAGNTILYFMSLLSPLVGLWMGRKRKISLWYYLLICIVTDIVTLVFKKTGCPHAIVSNLFLLTEFWIISFYFKRSIWNKKWDKIYWVLTIAISLFFIEETYSSSRNASSDIESLNYFDAAFFYVIYILFSVVGLYKVMENFAMTSNENNSLLLSCVAFVLYASGTFLLLLFKDHVTDQDLNTYGMAWVYFFRPLNTLKNILLAFSLKNVPKGDIRNH